MNHSRTSEQLTYRQALLAGMRRFLPAPLFESGRAEISSLAIRCSGGGGGSGQLVALPNAEGPFCLGPRDSRRGVFALPSAGPEQSGIL